MKKKLLNWRLVQYELRNITGNIFVIIFGVFFPIMMSILFSIVFKKQLPEEMYPKAVTSIFITMSMIIPMAVLLIGYAANYSQELEKDIPLRLNLFGYRERTMLAAKMIAYLIFTTAAFLLYMISDVILLDIQVPKLSSAIYLIISLYALSVILFVLAHGIATIFKKFGPTYAVSMLLYFGFMILCGMMGVTVDQLPKGLKVIAKVFPMSYISSDFVNFWQGGKYNFAPFVQSFLFFGAISFIILILSIRKNQRVLK
ncbi:MAG: type transporter [Herbinix sp.]|jgi:ABC-2 type transport system permease protein|nr:type transporter [Herbinix sp.]